MKWRNSKERELLASGGSRDQTLPNKNNPNPDLSDAKLDRQSSVSPPSPMSPSYNSSDPTQQPQQQQLCLVRSPASSHSPGSKSSPVDQKLTVKKPSDLKHEIDEMNTKTAMVQQQGHPPMGQFFNNFYDNQSSDGSMKGFNHSHNSMYYDEYDSNGSSDSEEINVT